MGAEYDMYYNLAERIDGAFIEIDTDVCSYLRKNDGKYMEMHREAMKLQDDFPVIPQITEGDGDVSLSATECKALARYFKLKMEMENMERKPSIFAATLTTTIFSKRAA